MLATINLYVFLDFYKSSKTLVSQVPPVHSLNMYPMQSGTGFALCSLFGKFIFNYIEKKIDMWVNFYTLHFLKGRGWIYNISFKTFFCVEMARLGFRRKKRLIQDGKSMYFEGERLCIDSMVNVQGKYKPGKYVNHPNLSNNWRSCTKDDGQYLLNFQFTLLFPLFAGI